MRYIKHTVREFDINSSRDIREMREAKLLGYEVLVRDCVPYECEDCLVEVSEFPTYRTSKSYMFKKGKLARLISKLKFFIIDEPKYLRAMKPDVVSCRNIASLFVGYVAFGGNITKREAKLIYDAHEFEIGCRYNEQRNWIFKKVIKWLEKYLMERADLSIVVNDIIADEMQRIHKLKTRPLVVRNTPYYWEIDKEKCKIQRAKMKKELKSDNDFLVMYHGGIKSRRGIEQLLEATQYYDKFSLVIMGFVENNFDEEIKNIASKFGIEDRVLLRKGVSPAVLWQYVGAVDSGVTLIQGDIENHLYSLPNKLFECIQSLTPVIGCNFFEMKKIIEGYKIGITVDPSSPKEIAQAIKEMKENQTLYKEFEKNLLVAKEELCWEREKKILISALSSLT